jgi:hypothetical protein
MCSLDSLACLKQNAHSAIFHLPKQAYDTAMKNKPRPEEHAGFENLLGEVIGVSKAEITRRIEEDKRKKRTSKASIKTGSAVKSNPKPPKRFNRGNLW